MQKESIQVTAAMGSIVENEMKSWVKWKGKIAESYLKKNREEGEGNLRGRSGRK